MVVMKMPVEINKTRIVIVTLHKTWLWYIDNKLTKTTKLNLCQKKFQIRAKENCI